MSNGYGKSNRVTAAATISSDTANYTVNTAKASGYVAGVTDFTLTINAGVFISSGSTGSYAMTVDTSWSAGDTVTIVNNGTIVGRGGDGGTGGTAGPADYWCTGVTQYFPNGSGVQGGAGGPALLVQRAITMNNLNRIAGGGGGGGGRNGTFYQSDEAPGGCGDYFAGGSGGGGIGGSSGGGVTQDFFGVARRNTGGAGGAGSLTSAGGGSSRNGQTGGSGGGYGSAGSAGSGSEGGPGGGAGGVCIQGNSNITYTNTGTRNGTINS
jgi:hypothetical protein